jgi:DNA-binding LacI/PurR family transcriptional regulator
MNFDKDDKKFLKTAEVLRKEVLGGEYFDSLPSERCLARQFGVSYMTMRRAVGELVGAGLLTREHGRGVFVNAPGRRLQRTYAIAMIVPQRVLDKHGKLSPFYSEVFAGAILEAGRSGYHIFLDCEVDNLIRLEHGERKVDALISVCPNETETLERIYRFIPVILAGHDDVSGNYPSVFYDNFNAAGHAFSYLYKLGHRRIAIFHGSSAIPAFYRRLCGARKAREDLRLEFQMELDTDRYGMEAAAETVANAGPDGMTACFCTNDALAHHLLSLLYQRGIRVPEQCSVVGFDNLDFSAITAPPLTTVSIPKTELGARSVQKALQYLSGTLTAGDFREQLPLKLIVRASTREMNG